MSLQNSQDKIYIYLDEGFGMQFRMYLLTFYFNNIVFVRRNLDYDNEYNINNNRSLDLFNFDNIINEDDIKNNIIYTFNLYMTRKYKLVKHPIVNKKILDIFKKTYNHKFYKQTIDNHKKYLSNALFNPIKPYSKQCLTIINKIKKNNYSIIGCRFLYPGINHKVSLNTFKNNIGKYSSFINAHDNLILMFDDFSFINFFTCCFIDLLRNKDIIVLSNINSNDIHELLYIASYCTHIVHNGSGLYDVIDNFIGFNR